MPNNQHETNKIVLFLCYVSIRNFNQVEKEYDKEA